MRFSARVFGLAVFALANVSVQTATAAASNAPDLDTARIHALYLDGDFDAATAMLERAIQDKKLANHSDSLFAYKHLGVMYAAKSESREKGKYYMLQLLSAEPTARILDMYASDMIYMIFKGIKEEFDANSTKLDRAESHVAGNAAANTPTPAKPAAAPPTTPSGGKNYKPYWVGGGVALAMGLGIGSYLLLSGGDHTTVHTYEVR